MAIVAGLIIHAVPGSRVDPPLLWWASSWLVGVSMRSPRNQLNEQSASGTGPAVDPPVVGDRLSGWTFGLVAPSYLQDRSQGGWSHPHLGLHMQYPGFVAGLPSARLAAASAAV